MKILHCVGESQRFLLIEKHESERQNVYIIKIILDTCDKKEIVGLCLNKLDLEEIRDSIDIELGPKE